MPAEEVFIMEHINTFKAALTAAMALLTALWGWFGWLIIAWVICMCLDVLTGMAGAAKGGAWSSKVAREGLLHKCACIVVVIIAGILDLVVGLLLGNMGDALPFTYTVLLCPLVVVWYILTEAGSITENAGKMGAPIPGWLSKMIDILQDTVDKAAGDENHK